MAAPSAEPHSSKNVIPYWRTVLEPGAINEHILNHPYNGLGTEEDPYVVEWIPNDPRNPMGWSDALKWFITMMVGISTLGVAMISSAYTGGVDKIMMEMKISEEVATLGVSLFVLGFAIGPLLWAPLSEMYGRQVVFFVSYMGLTAFNAGCAGAKNPQTLIILRFFAGSFGSSPLTNAGGVIADMFTATKRGMALSIFALMPFLGPVIGPIIGGFLGMTEGWRWVEGFLAIFSGAVWIISAFIVPETYAPLCLRRRAQKLSKVTGKHYQSKLDIERGVVKFSEAIKTSKRPAPLPPPPGALPPKACMNICPDREMATAVLRVTFRVTYFQHLFQCDRRVDKGIDPIKLPQNGSRIVEGRSTGSRGHYAQVPYCLDHGKTNRDGSRTVDAGSTFESIRRATALPQLEGGIFPTAAPAAEVPTPPMAAAGAPHEEPPKPGGAKGEAAPQERCTPAKATESTTSRRHRSAMMAMAMAMS
ncbi:hypothetical protein KEM56_007573, partial [Ascosphaera pollenicola]